jgi:DICT domain-containing protein
VPIQARDAMIREWVIVCEGARFAACLVGFEPPGQPGGERWFDTIWSVEPPVVRAAARVCGELAVQGAPQLADDLQRLADPATAHPDDVRRAASLTTRMVLYATRPLIRHARSST